MTDKEFEEHEIEAAEREAGAVGGKVDSHGNDAERAVREGGGGEAEGFEESERELIEHTSHADQAPAHRVLHDQGKPEELQVERVDGDADHESAARPSRIRGSGRGRRCARSSCPPRRSARSRRTFPGRSPDPERSCLKCGPAGSAGQTCTSWTASSRGRSRR